MSADRNENAAPPPEPGSAPTYAPAESQRLWAPWRMRYVSGGSRESGCLLCNRLAENDDVRTLILHRGERAFVIMNLFPYNTGHVMIVPNAHVASPEDADAEMLAEMAALRGPVLRALRRALAPEGFNLGLNVGAVAGAGVADHLHEHVVPRWGGDANFMPIVAATTVMPELIPVTYAKLRAELDRELLGATSVSSLVLARERQHALVDASGRLPQVVASEGEPLWRAALREVHDRGAAEAELAGWAGDVRAGHGEPALLFRGTFLDEGGPGGDSRLVDIAEIVTGPDGNTVAATLERLSAEDLI